LIDRHALRDDDVRTTTTHHHSRRTERRSSKMYGSPAGTQVHAGQWQHDALSAAAAHRRHSVDSDFERELVAQHARAFQHKLIAVAAIVLTTLTLVVVI
jgi:hypothetical protein